MTTYYDVLGVDESATDEEIDSAFHDQTKKYHPDTSDHPDATQLSADVNKAKEQLIGSGPQRDRPSNDDELNYEWENGWPIRPVAGKSGPENQQDGDQSDTTTTERSRESDSDGDSDSTWDTSASETSDPDPDSKTRVNASTGASADGNQTVGDTGDDKAATGNGITRREALAMTGIGGGALLLANRMGWLGSDASDNRGGSTSQSAGSSPEKRIAVDPSGSIQDAIDRVAAGGTVEVNPGTYSQSITVDKEVTISAPGGATLDGKNADGNTALTVKDANTTIDGFNITRYSGTGIKTNGAETEISITDTEVTETGEIGVNIRGKVVTIDGLTVQDSGDTGLDLNISSDGKVTASDVLVERSKRNVTRVTNKVKSAGHGIRIAGAKNIAIDNIEVIDNEGDNLRIKGGDTRGQTVEITGSTVIGAGLGHNIQIAGTGGEDQVTIENIECNDSSGRGLDIGSNSAIDSVSIQKSKFLNNGDTGLYITSTPAGSVEINNISVKRSKRNVTRVTNKVRSAGHGIRIAGAKTTAIDNIEVIDNGGNNLRITGGYTRGQTVEITGSTVIGAGSKDNIWIAGTGSEDQVTIENIECNDSSERGLDIGANSAIDSVSIRKSKFLNNGDTGLYITSTPKGSVEINNTSVKRSKRNVTEFTDEIKSAGHGIRIAGAKNNTISNVTSTGNGGENIRIKSGDVRGQTVEIRNSIANSSDSKSGIFIQTTEGDDKSTIVDTEANSNAGYGLDLGAESVIIKNTVAQNNGDGPYVLRETNEEDAQISNSFGRAD